MSDSADLNETQIWREEHSVRLVSYTENYLLVRMLKILYPYHPILTGKRVERCYC